MLYTKTLHFYSSKKIKGPGRIDPPTLEQIYPCMEKFLYETVLKRENSIEAYKETWSFSSDRYIFLSKIIFSLFRTNITTRFVERTLQMICKG